MLVCSSKIGNCKIKWLYNFCNVRQDYLEQLDSYAEPQVGKHSWWVKNTHQEGIQKHTYWFCLKSW